jgi:diguanylate cyclase (GGDEF)-like protein
MGGAMPATTETEVGPDAAGAGQPRRPRKGKRSAREILSLLPEVGAILGCVGTIWVSIAMMLAQQYQTTEQSARHDAQNLARAFEENTERIVAGFDQTLLSARASYADNPDGFSASEWLPRRHRADPFLVQLAIIDPRGILVDSSIGFRISPPVDLSDREHFLAQLDPGRDELFISKPVTGRASNERTVQFSRKLLKKDGSFAGVIVLSLGCDQLSRFYSTLELGQGVVVLAGTDGVVRARGPLLHDAIGSNVFTRTDYPPLRTAAAGEYRSASSVDHVERIFSFRRLPDLPLMVLVGLDTRQVFAAYEQTRLRAMLTGGATSAIVLTLGVLWIIRRRRWLASSRALRMTLETISQGIVLIDAKGEAPVLNRRAAELLDLAPEAVRQGRDIDWPALLAAQFGAARDAAAQDAGGSDAGRAVALITRGSRTIEAQSHPAPSGGTVVTYTDITERKQAEARILHMAHHDALTGLANRVLLQERIGDAIREVGREAGREVGRGGGFALFCLDLDGFKPINDTLGHDAGDLVLAQFAERLLAQVRPIDTVARAGGDEFIVLLRSLNAETSAAQVAERLLQALPMPVELGGYVSQLGVSLGIALFPEHGRDGRTLLKHADMALYRAKADGRGTFRMFETWMDERAAERLALERDLRLAIQRGQIGVFFQPQFACDTLRLTGFEALARWPHAQRGYVPSSVFVALAEECGLIVPFGRMMLEQACEAAATWRPGLRLAVNVSPVQFRDAALLPWLADVLARTGIPPTLLELEVTEGVLIRDEEQALATLRAIKDLGVQVALDDFGTGYSSLSYLRRFPFDAIKIDKSFVHAQQADYGTRAIVEAVLAMSGRLDLRVVAEGVETEAQLALLREQGATEVQGFLLAGAMPARDVPRFLGTLTDGALILERDKTLSPVGIAAARRRRSDR